MRLIAGLSAKIKEIPTTTKRSCPVCGRQVRLHVTRRYIMPHFFYIPTVMLQSAYQAVCPSCAAVMALRPQRGKILQKHPYAPIMDGDLKLQGRYRPSKHAKRFGTP